MTILRPLIPMLLALGLAACFVRHAEPIGAAEPAMPGQWSGGWVAEPLETGGEPGFFAVADVDPARGVYSVSEADGDGAALEAPVALQLRRVESTLFLTARDSEDGPWMLFVVEEITADRIVLAWKPRADAFQQAMDSGVLAGHIIASAGDTPPEIDLAELSPSRQEMLAREWQSLFTSERIVLRRLSSAD